MRKITQKSNLAASGQNVNLKLPAKSFTVYTFKTK